MVDPRAADKLSLPGSLDDQEHHRNRLPLLQFRKLWKEAIDEKVRRQRPVDFYMNATRHTETFLQFPDSQSRLQV